MYQTTASGLMNLSSETRQIRTKEKIANISEDEMKRRKNEWVKPEPRFERGYGYIYSKHIEQADKGCDFDFLRTDFGSEVKEPDIY